MNDCMFCEHESQQHTTVNVEMPDGEIRQMRLKKSVYDKLFSAVLELRMLNNQRDIATRFRRRMRSIRATRVR